MSGVPTGGRRPRSGLALLSLSALGAVFGDLATSPLYAQQAIFAEHGDAVRATPEGVYGIASLVFWTLLIIASAKYAGVIMRAHNHGDGGVMALTALLRRRRVPRVMVMTVIGLIGAGLFIGDGLITPTITVTAAIEGLTVATPGLSHLVVPIALGVLIGLFAVQRFGTGAVGWMFGPVLLIWSLVIGILGARQVIMHPGVLRALSPTWAIGFFVDHGVAAWLTLGAVVLCVTGAEALYADRGHFGVAPIRLAWFLVVLPAVLLCYLGQGALILENPRTAENPFFLLVPDWGQIPLVILATATSVVASQAVISGSFSVVRQAIRLGFLPRLQVTHTSTVEGQIYVPLVNWLLCAGVILLVVVFQSSARLTALYGMAVTGTFIIDTVLFLAVAAGLWHIGKWRLVALGALFLTVELAFFSANLVKIPDGAWIPLVLGLIVALTMIVWRNGQERVTRLRAERAGPLTDFLARTAASDAPVVRLPGTAVFLSPRKAATPLSLRDQVEYYRAFQEHVLIVSVQPLATPHADVDTRFLVERIGPPPFTVTHLTIHAGYRDTRNIPEVLATARELGVLGPELDLENATYFISRVTLVVGAGPWWRRLRNHLFITMARNARSPIEHFRLPAKRTIMGGSEVIAL